MNEYDVQVTCPRCGNISARADVCDMCGVLLVPKRQRDPSPKYDPTNEEMPQIEVAESSGGRNWATMASILIAVVALCGFLYYRSQKSDKPAAPAATETENERPPAHVATALVLEDGPGKSINIRGTKPVPTPKTTDFIGKVSDVIDSAFFKSSAPPPRKRERRDTLPLLITSAPAVIKDARRTVDVAMEAQRTLEASHAALLSSTSINLDETMFRSAGRPAAAGQVAVPRPSAGQPSTPGGMSAKPIAVAEVSGSNFGSEVLAHPGQPVLVDFYATWCGPCKMLSPRVELLAGELSGKLKTVKLDIDANPEITNRYNVHAFPTLVLFKSGREVNRAVGVLDSNELRQFVQAQL